MIGTTLDIFRKLRIKAVKGFNEAERQLAKLSPGDYFIFDTGTVRVIGESFMPPRWRKP